METTHPYDPATAAGERRFPMSYNDFLVWSDETHVEWVEYEDAGITEYLIIDPRPGKERVYFYRLTAAGKYLAILPDSAGRYHSAVLPGFWFDPAWFWALQFPTRC